MTKLREAVLVGLAYALLTFLCLHPLFDHPASTVVDPVVRGGMGPIGLADVNLGLWKVAWACHALWTSPSRLFDSNVYFPSHDALAGAEHRLGHLLLFAPVYVATGNPVLAGQLHLLLSYALCGLAMYLLLRSWDLPRTAAFFGGFVCTLSPERAIYGPVASQLVPTQYLVFALPFLDRLLRRPDARTAALFGILLWQQMLCSYYLAYMSLFAVAAYAAGAGIGDRTRLQWAGVVAVVVAVGCAGLAMLPVTLPYLDFRAAGGLKDWSGSEVLVGASADAWRAWLYPPIAVREWGWRLPPRHIAYVGLLPLSLAVLGLVSGRSVLRDPRWKLGAALGVVLVSWVMALGPVASIGGVDVPLPYAAAMHLVPGFTSLRSPMRFRGMLTIGFAAISAVGFASIAMLAGGGRSKRWLPLAMLFVTILATAGEYDELRFRHGVATKATGDGIPSIYRTLAAQAPGSVLELPAWRSPDVNRSSEYVYASVFHWEQPLLNGASQYPPPNHDVVLGLVRALPDPRALDLLGRITGLRYVLLHEDRMPAGGEARWENPPGLRIVERFGSDVLFAVDSPREPDLKAAFLAPSDETKTMTGTPLLPLADAQRRATVEVLASLPQRVNPGAALFVPVRVTNTSGAKWPALAVGAAHRTLLALRWEDEAGRVVASDASANRVPWDIEPGQSFDTTMEIQPPAAFGAFRLLVGVMQDGEWFAAPSAPLRLEVAPSLAKPEGWVRLGDDSVHAG